ncbi:hypothetical protein [Lapillicoccus jejuensis]|uniref:Uncharacterized protein n=1 Tax=Lapillicoccus jejuensis TaxID=402171 RepID=A0A542DW68_9MICO|nr:hypothetical protein [Lapillicoccus jejuensis]TQJ07342.1 hypothetical protein FB458_0403 [Lapillicoccus jejuensis]
MSTVLDPFEQALRDELRAVTPPDGVTVGPGAVVAAGRRVRRRRLVLTGGTAVVLVALVVAVTTTLTGGRRPTAPAGPVAPVGLTEVTAPPGDPAATYGVTVGGVGTSATVWTRGTGGWTRAVDVALDPEHRRSASVVLPGSTTLVGFVPSGAARRAVVANTDLGGIASRPAATPVVGSSWSAFVTVPGWTSTQRVGPTDLVWWAADGVPVDADGRRGWSTSVDGVAYWLDARSRLWGQQDTDEVVALTARVGVVTGVGRTGPDGVRQTWSTLVPASVPAGPVRVVLGGGSQVTGAVGRLGPLGVLVARASDPQDPPTRLEWTAVDGRASTYPLG